jgi:hypothetical protein
MYAFAQNEGYRAINLFQESWHIAAERTSKNPKQSPSSIQKLSRL